MGPGSSKRGLTLAEVMVAGLVLLVALPPLITSLTTIWRLESAQASESHGTHIAHVVFETMLYRLYNGHRSPTADPSVATDVRGYKLNDTQAERTLKYQQNTPSFLQFFLRLRETGTAVVSTPGTAQATLSQYFDHLVHPQDKALPSGVTESSNPELASDLKNFRIDVEVLLHLDEPEARPPGTPRTDPAVDMARVKLDLTWPNQAGENVTRSFRTRLTRYLFEDNPLNVAR